LLGLDRQIQTIRGIWQPVLKLVVSLPNHLSKNLLGVFFDRLSLDVCQPLALK
jgi:hypothetical protein